MQAQIVLILPIPVVVVGGSAQILHLVDCKRPADEEEDEGNRVEPVIVAVQLFVASINGILMWFQLGLVPEALHRSHILIFHDILLIDLAVDEGAKQEGERNGGDECDDCSPYDHRRPQYLRRINAGYKQTLNRPVYEEHSHTGEAGEEFLMGEVVERVPADAGPSIIAVVLVEDFHGYPLGQEVEQPVEEDEEPNEPEGHTLPDMSLELNYHTYTLPVVVEAQHSRSPLSPSLDVQSFPLRIDPYFLLLVDEILQMKLETRMVSNTETAVYHRLQSVWSSMLKLVSGVGVAPITKLPTAPPLAVRSTMSGFLAFPVVVTGMYTYTLRVPSENLKVNAASGVTATFAVGDLVPQPETKAVAVDELSRAKSVRGRLRSLPQASKNFSLEALRPA